MRFLGLFLLYLRPAHTDFQEPVSRYEFVALR
jgi:hypothetical protein